ncbi:MAG: hypothetical protein AB7S78_12830 [Candidatus Omnitrophota bacterium]
MILKKKYLRLVAFGIVVYGFLWNFPVYAQQKDDPIAVLVVEKVEALDQKQFNQNSREYAQGLGIFDSTDHEKIDAALASLPFRLKIKVVKDHREIFWFGNRKKPPGQSEMFPAKNEASSLIKHPQAKTNQQEIRSVMPSRLIINEDSDDRTQPIKETDQPRRHSAQSILIGNDEPLNYFNESGGVEASDSNPKIDSAGSEEVLDNGKDNK